MNITKVAQTGIGRLGLYIPFYQNDASVDGGQYAFYFGPVITYGVLSVEHAGYDFYKDDVDGTRLNKMLTYGLRVASSPEMYAEYKWGWIGDYDVQVLRGQLPMYTISKNSGLIVGAELFDFNQEANSMGIDDQVKFYGVWRYDLSWISDQSGE